MNTRICIHCEDEFDLNTARKIQMGGKINECPDTDDRSAYSKMWRNNSGQNKGKSCQLGKHLSPTNGISFETVQKTEAVNHKGRMD